MKGMPIKSMNQATVGRIEIRKKKVIQYAHIDEIYVLVGSPDG